MRFDLSEIKRVENELHSEQTFSPSGVSLAHISATAVICSDKCGVPDGCCLDLGRNGHA